MKQSNERRLAHIRAKVPPCTPALPIGLFSSLGLTHVGVWQCLPVSPGTGDAMLAKGLPRFYLVHLGAWREHMHGMLHHC